MKNKIKEVKEVKETIYYQCPICGRNFDDKKLAEECANNNNEKPLFEIGDIVSYSSWDRDFHEIIFDIITDISYNNEAHKRDIRYNFNDEDYTLYKKKEQALKEKEELESLLQTFPDKYKNDYSIVFNIKNGEYVINSKIEVWEY